jgi:hypothetical protein
LTVVSSDTIRQFSGRYPRIDDPLMRAAYLRGVRVSAIYYPPGTADWDQKAGQVALNEQTREYLYTAYTPLSVPYHVGSRPALERIVARVTNPSMTQREKALAILRYCHHGFRVDWPAVLPQKTLFLNACEEEVLKLGGGQCEDRSRVIICLCQVAGIPARLVAVYSHFRPEENYALHGGHAIVEVCVEDGWAFFDSLADFYCEIPGGRIASLWDLRTQPDLVEKQPDRVYRDCGSTREKFIAYRDEYLSTRAVATLANYFVWDGWRYDWKWVRIGYDANDPAAVEAKRRHKEITRQVLAEIGIKTEG